MSSASKLLGKVSPGPMDLIPLEVSSTCKNVPKASWDVPYKLTEQENTKMQFTNGSACYTDTSS